MGEKDEFDILFLVTMPPSFFGWWSAWVLASLTNPVVGFFAAWFVGGIVIALTTRFLLDTRLRNAIVSWVWAGPQACSWTGCAET